MPTDLWTRRRRHMESPEVAFEDHIGNHWRTKKILKIIDDEGIKYKCTDKGEKDTSCSEDYQVVNREDTHL